MLSNILQIMITTDKVPVYTVVLWIPFLPEIIRFLRFTISDQVILFYIQGICTSHKPQDYPVSPGIRFIVGVTGYTGGVQTINPSPISLACLHVNRSVQYSADIRDTFRFCRTFAVHHRPRWTSF